MLLDLSSGTCPLLLTNNRTSQGPDHLPLLIGQISDNPFSLYLEWGQFHEVSIIEKPGEYVPMQYGSFYRLDKKNPAQIFQPAELPPRKYIGSKINHILFFPLWFYFTLLLTLEKMVKGLVQRFATWGL